MSTKNRNQKAKDFRASYDADIDIEIIPSTKDLLGEEEREEILAAYCRVSTKDESQAESYELQKGYYENYVSKHANWTLYDIYADEGISATSTKNRKEFLRLIDDCKAGKITLIITKSVSRFARNVVDCISYARMLKALPKPVGIFFETEHINTLLPESETQLSLLAVFAESESINKSTSVKWGIRGRFAHGIPKIVDLYGFDKDERQLFANPEQSGVIQLMYDVFEETYSVSEVQNTLYERKILSPMGKERWPLSSIFYILTNEKYVGDVLMQKTVCIDVFLHKTIKNDGRERRYLLKNHHAGIIKREQWDNVQKMLGNCSLDAYFVGEAIEFDCIPEIKFNTININ